MGQVFTWRLSMLHFLLRTIFFLLLENIGHQYLRLQENDPWAQLWKLPWPLLSKGPSAEIYRGIVKGPGGNSRIIVCAAGPNTYGPGSVPHSLSHPNYAYLEKNALKWMDHLGKEALRQHTVVDILCAGTCPVRVPLLQPLSKSSGGILLSQDDFGEAFGVNLQRAASRAAGSGGFLEIRCSDDIVITQVVGPGEEAQTDGQENFKNDASLTVQMRSVEETQSFSVFMENSRDIKHDHAFFQFVIQYSNVYQAYISRVITVRDCLLLIVFRHILIACKMMWQQFLLPRKLSLRRKPLRKRLTCGQV